VCPVARYTYHDSGSFDSIVLQDILACVAHATDSDSDSFVCGSDAISLPNSRLSWPLSSAINTMDPDWDGLAALLKYVFYDQLGIDRLQSDCPLLCTIPTRFPSTWKDKLTQIAFDQLMVPALCVLDQGLAALYGAGVLSGFVLDVGHEFTDISVVIDGLLLKHASTSIPIGGRDLDLWILELAREDTQLHQQLEMPMDLEFARLIKESGASRVLQTPDESMPTDRVTCKLLDKTVTIGPWRALVAEPLFNPGMLTRQVVTSGIIQELLAVSRKLDIDQQRIAWGRVLVTGQSSKLAGFHQRLQWELQQQLPITEYAADAQPSVEFKLICSPPDYLSELADRGDLLTLLGGKIASKVIFADERSYITRSDYVSQHIKSNQEV